MPRKGIPKGEIIEIADIAALVGFIFLAAAFVIFMFYNPAGVTSYSDYNITAWILGIFGIVLIVADIGILTEMSEGHKFRHIRK